MLSLRLYPITVLPFVSEFWWIPAPRATSLSTPQLPLCFRKHTNARRDRLSRAVPIRGYHPDGPKEKVEDVTFAHLRLQDRQWRQEPFIEADLGHLDAIIGLRWLQRYKALPDCAASKIIWRKGDLPPRAPRNTDIIIDPRNLGGQIRPDHQVDADRRDALIARDQRRRREHPTERVGIAAIRLANPPRIRRTKEPSTFSTDQAASYCKMHVALNVLNADVRYDSEYDSGYESNDLALPPKQRIDTAGFALDAYNISVPLMRLWVRRARQGRCAVGTVSLEEIDREIDHHLQRRFDKTLPLPEDESDAVRELIEAKLPAYLSDYADVCSKVRSDELPPPRESDHKIKLTNGKPLTSSPIYHMSLEHLQLMKDYLQENLAKGFISKSLSPYASPVLFAKKPGGGWRFCVDFRKLNARTEIDPYPLPLIEEVLDKLQGATIFTKVDVRQAFNRIRMHADSISLTAFRTRYGVYQYNVLPFGLCNGPATFQRYINEVLFDLLDECCTAYVDDILIYSKDAAEHQKHVRQVFSRLRAAGLQVDIKKSEFSVTRTKFLGFIISTHGLAVDPDKIEAIVHWQEPTTIKGIQSFLGFCNFYRRFIHEYGRIALPLIQLTKKGLAWSWTDAHQEAFERLKQALIAAPVLVHFNPRLETILETDASGGVAAGVLSQKSEADGFFHPVAFYSKTLSATEMRYDIHDKEMLAIVLALKRWKADLVSLRTPFLIITDHKALEYFSEKTGP